MQSFLPLELPENPKLAEFIVSPANETAYMLAMGKITVPSPIIIIEGESGSGKTHLCHLWAAQHDAEVIFAEREIPQPRKLRNAPFVAVDNVEFLSSQWLFSLINQVQLLDGMLFATATNAPDTKTIMPDVASRLALAHHVTIDQADDMLLKSLLIKQLSKHQIRLPNDLLDYVLKRIQRSYRTILDFPDKLAYHLALHPQPLTQEILRSLLQST